MVGSRSEFRDIFVRRDMCCGLLNAAKHTLVLLYWRFVVPDFIYSTNFYIYLYMHVTFSGLKDLF